MRVLHYSPGACSLAAHVVLEELALPFELARTPILDGATRTAEYLRLNPRAVVPTLVEDDFVLTESTAILGHLAALRAERGLVPREPRLAARTWELLSVFTTGVHVAFRQFWRPERFTDDRGVWPALQDAGVGRLRAWFDWIEGLVEGRTHPVGDVLTLVDPYLLVFYRWGVRLGAPTPRFDMRAFPAWTAHTERMLALPAVRRAMASEGIVLG